MPAALLVVWGLARRAPARATCAGLRRGRVAAAARAVQPVGDLGVLGCCARWPRSLCIVALARPQALMSSFRKASADIVILQDASASMYVKDVQPDRWRRSVRFLRTFAEALSWKGDRVALALFAQLAAPQVRLTKDPNALFFFLDHLGDHSPFRAREHADLGHQHRGRHPLGAAAGREGRGAVRQERQSRRRSS